jgi:hypothetical protein
MRENQTRGYRKGWRGAGLRVIHIEIQALIWR